MTTNIKYFGEAALAKLIALIKGMDLGDFTNSAGYAKSADVPTKVSDLTNDSGFITSSSVPTKVSDLTNDEGFITSSDIPAIPSKTSDLTNDSGFITSASIPTVPTKTSDLTNDSGFLTSADMSGYLPTTGGTMTGRLLIERTTTAPADTNSEEPFATLAGSDLVKGTNPLSQRIFGIYVTDKTKSTNPDGRLATLECVVGTNGRMAAVLAAHKNAAGETDHSNRAAITAVWDENNKSYGLAPTPALGDDSGKIATTEWIWDQFLPLAGGTMTGGIVRNGTLAVGSADSASIGIYGGTAYANGGAVIAYGKTNSGSPGWVRLHAQDASDSTDLILKPNGTFTVGGATIAKISDLSSYLPLSGGTMTGTITKSGTSFAKSSSDASYIEIDGGTAYNKGAYLRLNGKDLSGYTGSFALTAHDGTTGKSLAGKADGTLTWGGVDIVTAQGGVATNGNFLYRSAANGYLRISGGSSASLGGNVVFRGESATNNAGGVEISANDNSNLATMYLRPDSTATWAGKTLVYGKGTHSLSNIDAYGYVTSDGKQMTLILPILVKGTVSASNLTVLTAAVRKSEGGYASPGGVDGESLIPSGVTKTIGIRDHHLWINLVRSAGWSVTNNTLINAFIYSVTFKVT